VAEHEHDVVRGQHGWVRRLEAQALLERLEERRQDPAQVPQPPAAVRRRHGLHEALLEKIDLERTHAKLAKHVYHSKLMIYLKVRNRQDAWALRKAILKKIEENSISANNKVLKVGVEIAEEDRPLARADGRFYGTMETMGVDKQRFRLEYKRLKTQHYIQVLKMGGPEAKPPKLAKFVEESGWEIYQAVWDTLGTGKSERELYGALTA